MFEMSPQAPSLNPSILLFCRRLLSAVMHQLYRGTRITIGGSSKTGACPGRLRVRFTLRFRELGSQRMTFLARHITHCGRMVFWLDRVAGSQQPEASDAGECYICKRLSRSCTGTPNGPCLFTSSEAKLTMLSKHNRTSFLTSLSFGRPQLMDAYRNYELTPISHVPISAPQRT